MLSLEALAKARLQGAKPAVVFVTIGGKQLPWWKDGTACEVVIGDREPVGRLDLRPLVGCDVIVIAWQRDARLRAVVGRLQALPAERMTVLSSADPDDLGHVWERDSGWRRLCDGPKAEAA